MRESALFGRQSTRPDPRRSSRGAGANVRRIVRVATSRAPTSTAPSWLRYSAAPNQNSFAATSGPPAAPATCCRSKGSVSPEERSNVAGSPCQRWSRAKSDTDPRSWSLPDFVTTLITEEAERPDSAVNRFVAIWNSCTDSCVTFCSGPPTTSSLLSAPSTVMFPPRPSWPADEMTTLFDLVGSKFGAGAFPGTRSASCRKLRPLSGSASMAVDGMTASTTERVVSTPVTLTATSTASRTPATVSSISTAAACPTSRTSPVRFASAKPRAVTVRSTTAGGRLATTKVPSLAVGTVRDNPVVPLLTITVADGTAAPCASRTCPRRVAVVCP